MYLEHFALTEAPFSITPDTGFYFGSASHQEALNVLLLALRSGDGFIKVTGEVGTGKTLLCRKLLNTLGEDFVSAYIPNPFLNPTALRMALAEELGIEFARNIGQHRLLKLIGERLLALSAGGRQVVVLLDEAQAIPDDSLEALRLLTNLETEKHKLLQVVLFGQPELDARLQRRALRQLKQRVIFSHHLQPLDRAGLEAYVGHRLRIAGAGGRQLFVPGALRLLHRASRGVPRLINVLGHKALMAAYGRGGAQVVPEDVRGAAADTEDATRLRRLWPQALRTWGAAAGGAGLGVGIARSLGL